MGKVQVPIAATPCSSFRYASGSPTAPELVVFSSF